MSTNLIKGQLCIINKRGLHARAAAKLASLSSQFESQVRLGFPERMVDGKSIMALLMLAASQGTTLHAEIHGEDAHTAFDALTDLFARRFDEEE